MQSKQGIAKLNGYYWKFWEKFKSINLSKIVCKEQMIYSPEKMTFLRFLIECSLELHSV